MAMDEGVKPKKDVLPGDDESTEVKPIVDALIIEPDIITDTLMSQDKLLKHAARERKEFKDKLKVVENELKEAKKLVVHVSDDVECDECTVYMTNFSELQSKYVVLLDENDELKARSSLLGACKSCSSLQSELAEKNVKILTLEKASSDSTIVECARCESLMLELKSCKQDKMRSEEDNTYLRSILNWVSCSEPQLGMMMSQFRRGTRTSGVGFALGGKGEHIYSKVGEFSGLSPSEKPSTNPKLIKINPPKPNESTVKDGVFEEPLRAPPQK
jgi:ribosome-binding ATPase YchF (GTP1/OBG family)